MPGRLDHHLIYDAILDEDAFQALPEHLARLANARSCWMLWQDAEEAFVVSSHHGHWSPLEIAAYAEAGAPTDPLIAASRRPGVINRFDSASNVLGQDAFLRSEFYNEQIRRSGSGTYWIAGASFDTPYGIGTVGLHREKTSGDFSSEEITRLAALNDDIRRMLAIRSELLAARMPASLDFPLRAALRLNAEGQVLGHDAAADMLVREHPLLRLTSAGLEVAGTLGTLFHDRLLRAADPRMPRPDILRLPSPSDELPDLQLNFVPDIHAPGEVLLIVAQKERPRALLPTPLDQPAPPRLTAREHEILLLLTSGERRDRIAHRLGISVPTVDLHLSKMRRKLGTRTLPEMVAEAVRWGLI
ncbi:hypothetical protein KM176_13530 [Pseudooceanicola sp. CBS1P-1]|uniref:HTH luxR-type domain-containing protein n=1 Tax=Pseudooceanicola albus TaxID=2692189 RepID=A0A6L7G426_9RHOB|nr:MULTISPECIES: LuxR C-terminal-related transcriptional regulator [Pseudooceanicola]MBT9384886.1 hypothetical protein [Pseudooceanicola endophyticus]MXN18120.1 hypothetical protein [Pseudooceanicola albus]